MWGLPAVKQSVSQSVSQASGRTGRAREKEPSCVVSGPSVVAAVIAVGLAPLLHSLLLSRIYTYTHAHPLSLARVLTVLNVYSAHACLLAQWLAPGSSAWVPAACCFYARSCHAIPSRLPCPTLPCPSHPSHPLPAGSAKSSRQSRPRGTSLALVRLAIAMHTMRPAASAMLISPLQPPADHSVPRPRPYLTRHWPWRVLLFSHSCAGRCVLRSTRFHRR